MLQLNTVYARATIKSHHGSKRDNFIMDDVKCTGTEDTLEDCPHKSQDDCGPREGAGVICYGKYMKLSRIACSVP